MFLCSRQTAQATLEAALLIPIIFLLLLLLIQPAILLYDRCVMVSAATQGCRLLSTTTSVLGDSSVANTEAIKRNLSAVPPVNLFHVCSPDCTWKIEVEGNEGTGTVSVEISTKVELLPVIKQAVGLFGSLDENGLYTMTVKSSLKSQADWVANSSLGLNPSGWVAAR